MIKSKIYRGRHGQRSVLLPARLVELLQCQDDQYILADFQRFQPAYMRLLSACQKAKKKASIVFGDKSKPQKIDDAIIELVTQENVTVFSKQQNKSIMLPLSCIITVK